jgi:hypothetical protein
LSARKVKKLKRQRTRLAGLHSDPLGVFGVPIVQEIATVAQGAASLHGGVPSNLPHPRLVRVNGDAGDVDRAAPQMDEKKHVVGHQPAQRQHLRREEVSPSQQRCRRAART